MTTFQLIVNFRYEKIADENRGGANSLSLSTHTHFDSSAPLPHLLIRVVNLALQVVERLLRNGPPNNEICFVLDQVLYVSELGNAQSDLRRSRFEGHRLFEDKLCLYAQQEALKSSTWVRRNNFSCSWAVGSGWSAGHEESTSSVRHDVKRVSRDMCWLWCNV